MAASLRKYLNSKLKEKGLKKLPKAVRNKMGYMSKGGMTKSTDMRKTGMFYGGGMAKKGK